MNTPVELVSLAVRGTTQQSAQGNHQTAGTMLRLYGIHSFQMQGGYIPPYDMKELNPDRTPGTGTYVHPHHLKHLHLILDEHPAMLEEWIEAVCESGRTVPDEYIPYLLDLGCQKTHLQKWLKLLMSDTALWLLNQHSSGNWRWYPGCEADSYEAVLRQQHYKNRALIYKISISLASEDLNTRNHRGLSLLQNFVPLWTTQIASLLIKAMFISNITASYNEDSLILKVVRKAGYRLPLSFAEEFLSELRSGAKQWHQLADELELIFKIRYEMLASMRESGQ